jgi:hypothetical protein
MDLFFELLPESPETGQTGREQEHGRRFGDGNRIRGRIDARVKDRVRRRTRDRTGERTGKETGIT